MADMEAGSPRANGNPARRTVAELLVGAALGMGVTGLVGPGALSWWYQPPIKDAFSCASSVHAALQQFVWMQLITAVVLAVGTVLVSFLVRRKLAARKQS